MMFQSPTYGKLSQEEVFNFIYKKIKKDNNYKVIIGTDSQNTYRTKMVLVICLIEEGRGGNFFYNVEWMPKIKDLNNKIFTETERSLQLARELNLFLKEKELRASVEIHVDIGREGKTKILIQSIVGWVGAEGMECKIKPDSFVASSIADKISK